jgi:acetyl-CoA C-acetyltransferase
VGAVDKNSPVIVGVAQVRRRPTGPDDLNDPVSLMAEVARAAAADAGPAGLLERLDSVRVIESLGWRSENPPAAVSAALGLEPRDLVATATGGNGPLSLLHDTASAVSRGELDAALLVGAEALYSRRVARLNGVRAPEPATPPGQPPRVLGNAASGVHEAELAVGLALPAHVYPLFSNAMARRGGGHDEQREREARLYARFSEVAANNTNAWSPQQYSAQEIREPAADNRMIAFPYTKRCCANIQVDQSAAAIVMSAGAAEAAGIPKERWVFPWAGTEAHDHWFVSERERLDASPAIASCWQSLRALSGVAIDDIAHVDLYSCFPSAVLIAAEEIGLDPEDADRPLTLTGGLSFAGGPGNNYSMHSLATAVSRLREQPGLGLVTGVGWFLTKHALSLLGSEPPAAGFAFASVQAEVDALPKRGVISGPTSGLELESFTVVYDREGEPEKAIVSGRDSDGRRGWAQSADPAFISALLSEEQVTLP